MEYSTMPFGKFKGYQFEEIPLTYLVYALDEFDLPDEIIEAITYWIIKRLKMPAFTRQDVLINLGYVHNKLIEKYDPKKVGTDLLLNVVNETVEKFEEAIDE